MAVIGAVLGDIAGSRFEFHRPGRLDYKKCELFVPVCTYTDDTVMTLAVKKAIEENLDRSLRKYFRRLYPYPDG